MIQVQSNHLFSGVIFKPCGQLELLHSPDCPTCSAISPLNLGLMPVHPPALNLGPGLDAICFFRLCMN